MIPVKLSIQGLYSYQARQEIEFQPLVGASVFGIFGKVGSGKSSLLEAISFALYGESERLNGRDNRAYNMMNLKSGHLIIDFEFRAGPAHQLYKFVYEAKRHAKKHQDVSATKHAPFRWEDGQWLPIGTEKDDIALLTQSILGLDYDNFKRTTIIPQNQFREFLELNPKDRTEMMSRLFRLEKYDLSARVAKVDKANEAALNLVKGQLDGLESASPEAIAEAQQAVDAIDIAIREQEKEIALLDEREKQLLDQQKRHQERETIRTDLEKWKADLPKFQQIQARLEQYEQCGQLFRALLDQVDAIARKQQVLTTNIQASEKKRADAAQRLPLLLQQYQTARTAFENRDALQKQIAELDDVRFIQGNQYSIEQQTRQRNALRQEADRQDADVQQLRNERANQQTRVNQAGGDAARLEQLYAMQHWFTVYEPLCKAVDGLTRKIEQYERDKVGIKKRKTIALTGFLPEWSDVPLKDLPDTIRREMADQQAIADERKNSYDDHLLRQKVYQYANALIDGKPCPLCGSEHHPAIRHDATVDADVARSKEAFMGVQQRISEMNTLLGKAEGLLGELKTVHSQGKNLINEHAEAVLERTRHEDRFVWPAFTMAQGSAVQEAIRQEKMAQETLRNAQKTIADLTRQLDELEPKKAGLETGISELNGTLTSLTDTVAKELARLVYFRPDEVRQLNPQRINDLTDELTVRYEAVGAVFTQAEEARSAAEGEQTKYQTEVDGYTKQQLALQQERDGMETAVADALAQHGYTRPQVADILASHLDLPTERERVQAYQQQLLSLQNQFDALTADLTGQPFDADALEYLQQELAVVREQYKIRNQELGEKRTVHHELTEQWERKQAIQQQVDALMLREKDLTTMKELFRAQGFVNYVSSVYLQNLCEAANTRFAKLTNNQLKLEVDDKNNFLVRDHLNGGKTRLAKTLSGGQLFQASLSLALALSDNIQHLTKSKQNLFFLDEGFGSLDKDSLQLVFKTLQSLRNENRIVGIISHVEELQHEIETFIRAEHSDTGSRITRSWE